LIDRANMDGHQCQETVLSRSKPVLSRPENASKGFRAQDIKYNVTVGQACLSKIQHCPLPADSEGTLNTVVMSVKLRGNRQDSTH